jgi:hypothetical protein
MYGPITDNVGGIHVAAENALGVPENILSASK